MGVLAIMALVVGANAVIFWLSLRYAPNLVVEDYYEQGLAYDRVIDSQRRSALTGWRVALLPVAMDRSALAFRVTDREGRPLRGLSGDVRAYRPSDAALDQTLPLQEAPDQPGVYRFRFIRPMAGLWKLTVNLAGKGSAFSKTLPHVAR